MSLVAFRGGPFDGERREVPEWASWPIEVWWRSDDVLVPQRLAGVYLRPAAEGLAATWSIYIADIGDMIPPPWFPSH